MLSSIIKSTLFFLIFDPDFNDFSSEWSNRALIFLSSTFSDRYSFVFWRFYSADYDAFLPYLFALNFVISIGFMLFKWKGRTALGYRDLWALILTKQNVHRYDKHSSWEHTWYSSVMMSSLRKSLLVLNLCQQMCNWPVCSNSIVFI